eukprot:m.22981 g.22981  ORF g.22981 m.22981 type:complete len:148 (-) comp11315_c0_seq2:1306-1749(-)
MDVPCSEFAEFKRIVGELRVVDDQITHKLNTVVPTRSNVDDVSAKASCAALWEQMNTVHAQRTAAMHKCLTQITAEVKEQKSALGQADVDLRAQQGKGKASVDGRKLREKQALARDITRELMAEEILQEQTAKIFKDRCGRYFTPSS